MGWGLVMGVSILSVGICVWMNLSSSKRKELGGVAPS